MSVAEALQAARHAGIDLHVDGFDLVLEASAPPPPAVIDLLSRYKADVIAMLRPAGDVWSAEDLLAFYEERAAIAEFDGGQSREQAEAHAFDCCITEWLNRHLLSSDSDCCAWCHQPDTAQHAVVPFNANDLQHTWLHPECWQSWHEERRSQAQTSLLRMGLGRAKSQIKDQEGHL